ncbi:MFS transporter [Candidatus Entotheonella palauensis]|uniref:MFS transporter n=1 Tax=Candidatus Entotheonella palauensis TaxID=93172 RepID=UPI0015C423D5|nr:MFS transporter [Candidatus Entotheonella palauensis]
MAPFIGRLADRYGPRWIMPLGTLLLGLGLFVLAGSEAIWVFFLVAVLIRAISQPLLIGVVPQTNAVSFFRRQRNLALALTGLFRPVSGAILIPLISAVAVVSNWRTAFHGLGVLSLLFTLPMLLVIRRRPEDIGLRPDGDPAESHVPARTGVDPEVTNQTRPSEPVWTAREVLRTRAFWFVAIAMFLSVSSSSSIGFNMVPYLHETAHLSTTQAAGVLSVGTLFALTNLVWGYVADKLTPRRCMIGAMLGGAGMILFLIAVDSLLSAYAFGMLWGIVSSAQVLVYMILARYFGQASYGAIAGTMRPFEAGGLGVGQSLGTLLYDVTGNYDTLIIAALGAHLLAALLMLLARPPVPPSLAFVSDAP